MRPAIPPFQQEEWAIGLPKDHPELMAEVNRFIDEFKKSGGFDQLADKYLPEQKTAFKKLGVPFVF